MNEIREPLELHEATSHEMSTYPTEKGFKGVLEVSAPFGTDLADILGVRNQFFDQKDMPYAFTGNIGLTHLWKAVEIGIDDGLSPIRPDLVHKLKVEHAGDLKLNLKLKIHFSEGHVDLVYDWFRQNKKEPYTLSIVPLQEEMFPGGDRVELSAGDGRTVQEVGAAHVACPHCGDDAPLSADGTEHVLDGGELVPCTHPSEAAVRDNEAENATLARAGQMRQRKEQVQ